MEQMMGIEPTSLGWKPSILTVVLHLQMVAPVEFESTLYEF